MFYLQSMKIYLHMSNVNVQQNLLYAAFCHKESSHLAPVLAYDFLSRCKSSTCYEPLERFIGIMEPRQDNGKQQRHVFP